MVRRGTLRRESTLWRKKSVRTQICSKRTFRADYLGNHFSIFLLENTNNKNFPNCNSPVLMILMTRPLILRQEHFLLHSKVFLQPGIFFWGARTRHDLLKLVFCNGLIFFARLERKVPEQLQGRLFLAGATQILASQIKRILLRLKFCHFWSRSPLHKFNGSKAFTWFI